MINNVPDLIIKSKTPQEIKKIKEEITKNIKPAELKIGVKNIIPAKNGSIIIKCQSKTDVEILQNEAKKKLDSKYNIEITKMRNPRIKIFGYEGELSRKEIEECIKYQNQFIDKEEFLNITYVKKTKYKGSVIFGECSPKVFHTLMKEKKLFIEWQRYTIYEDLEIPRCFKCQQYFHKTKDCKNKLVCAYCAEEHETKDCPKSSKKCNNCAIANERFKLQHDICHETSNRNCPSYIHFLQTQKSKINYGTNNG